MVFAGRKQSERLSPAAAYRGLLSSQPPAVNLPFLVTCQAYGNSPTILVSSLYGHPGCAPHALPAPCLCRRAPIAAFVAACRVAQVNPTSSCGTTCSRTSPTRR